MNMIEPEKRLEAALERMRQHDPPRPEDLDAATNAALKGFGPSVVKFLYGALGPRGTEAEDAFQEWREACWKALPRFRGESSFRTYSFTIACNVLRAALRRRKRDGGAVPLTTSECSKVAQEVLSDTLQAMPPALSARAAALREKLTEDECILLLLRVDLDFSWTEVVTMMSEEPVEAPDREREAARLRKVFERLVDKVGELPEIAELRGHVDVFRAYKEDAKRRGRK